MRIWRRWIALLAVAGAVPVAVPAPPSIEAFAARAPVERVAISPDGRYVAQVRTAKGRAGLVVTDRRAGPDALPTTVMGEPEKFHFRWCEFATDTRLLCSFWANAQRAGFAYPVTRLAGVDASGANMKVLVQNSPMAQGQYLDRIVHWHPGPPNVVLIEADEGLEASGEIRWPDATVYGDVGTHAAPAVFELNVVTGAMKVRQHARPPIRHWIADPGGEVRIGFGISGTVESYFARLKGDSNWRRLERFEAFSRNAHFEPVAISALDPNKAYAIAPSEGRAALWLIDLTDKADPELVFAHPVVSVSDAQLGPDGRLLGVHYETDYPNVYYIDGWTESAIAAVGKLQPNSFNTVVGSSRDAKVLVIYSRSDLAPSTFSILDTGAAELLATGGGSPALPATAMARMKPISYPARDGTEIPGYLSLPRDGPTTSLPLIVMPHGGPIARDVWGWDFLRQFLASRGYAVLEMNFRGSSGYSDDWFFAAHQDWGGLTYDDVVDGTRWAIKQGIADPARVCIVGWSFGGYLALVGGQRNSDLFRCAVSIAGVSDLGMLVDEQHFFLDSKIAERQIGLDHEKLRHDSPRLHAGDVNIPVLMVHGTLDANVPLEQSRAMDSALTRAKKPHRLVVIPDADHSLTGEGFRVTLLTEVAAFLAQHLPAPAAAPP